ncbi:MAG: AAA family ATPase [Victivallaceae bacterium]|nr:AAA family ATPase [Victivallaceae bacterium]
MSISNIFDDLVGRKGVSVRNTGDDFTRNAALCFFRRICNGYRDAIDNSDFFELIVFMLDKNVVRQRMLKAFDLRYDRNRDSYVLPNGAPWDDMSDPDDALQTLYRKSSAMRTKVMKFVVGLIDDKLAKCRNTQKSVFRRKFDELVDFFGLSENEAQLLLVSYLLHSSQLEVPFLNGYSRGDVSSRIRFFCMTTGLPDAEVRKALARTGRLMKFECLDNDLDFNPDLGTFLCGLDNTPLSNSSYRIVGDDEVMPWEFYDEITKEHGDILQKLLSSKDGHPAKILFYGDPGTGKSSFAKSLVHRIGVTCYMISQETEQHSGVNFRFAALEHCSKGIAKGKGIVIVDEADRMLAGGSLFNTEAAGDKSRLNAKLDDCTVPTIWISNTPEGVLDESSRRRFDYSVRFNPLSDHQRKIIWHNCLGHNGLSGKLSDETIEEAVKNYPVNAGVISTVVENLVKLKVKPKDMKAHIDKLMAAHCRLLEVGIDTKKKDNVIRPAKDYSLEGLNVTGSLPLEKLVEAVRKFYDEGGKSPQKDTPRMNILLSGPPGAGKTEFVKYLANAVDKPLMVMMGSNILDCWVGQTERNIAAAFAEAESRGAILFFDEVDSMLSNRHHAFRTWEVSQVNELLNRMENFSGVMIGATNFIERLDQAVMRRFTFKMELGYLDRVGKEIFYRRMFERDLNEDERAELASIPNLTPGDFRTVRQKMYYIASGDGDYLKALRAESESKRTGEAPRVGF